MPEYRLVLYGAPTLAGIKTGSLFPCPFSCQQELLDSILRWNRQLGPKGLRILPLRRSEAGALLYLYRPGLLRTTLADREARALLIRYGYPPSSPDRCVAQLARRMRSQEDFPHEVGLFLGYPPEDVRGFIDNHAHCCKCEGCWKVYGDAEAAQERFRQYKSCTRLYCDQWAAGVPLEHLTVNC